MEFGAHSLSPDVTDLLRLIGRKWSLNVIHTLVHEPMGFGELKQKINGVSASVLSDLLSEFLDREIIEKRSISISPPRSAYFISTFGAVLCDIVDSILIWSEELVRRKSHVQVEEAVDSA